MLTIRCRCFSLKTLKGKCKNVTFLHPEMSYHRIFTNELLLLLKTVLVCHRVVKVWLALMDEPFLMDFLFHFLSTKKVLPEFGLVGTHA